jgi:predicted DNA-binding ribbon-helix-helix protein
MGRLQSLLLDGCSVYCLQPGSHIVLFLQRFKIFFLPPRCRAIFSVGCRGFTTDGGGFMKSLVIKRSVVVAGHKTSVSLEDAFWKGMKEIAHARDLTLSELIGAIDSEREYGNLSSALRLFVLEFYRSQISDLKEGRDGPDQGSESSGEVRIRRMAQARH